ncbi:MAG: gluconate 2-dehydrogenase subunit 3 family protein [Pseudomonadota bacterium]
MQDFRLQRRQVFQSLLALSVIGGLAACADDGEAAPRLAASKPGFLTADEMGLVSAVAQTLIPMTATAGAVQAGVPDTIQDLATDWGDDAFRTYWREGLLALQTALGGESGPTFTALSPSERAVVLAAYDASVFDGQVEDGFYRDFKATVVQAYYMSEPGASEELAYEPVPGEWIGCVPLADFPKNWAT